MTEGFQHAIAGGQGNLIITSLQSPNFVHDISGWQVDKNGNAEFNSLTIRGTFFGTDFIISAAGIFLYSGTPALGNLSASLVPGAVTVTDPEGNTAQPGITSYSSSTTWISLLQAVVQFMASATQFSAGKIAGAVAGQVAITSGEVTNTDTAAEVEIQSASAAGGSSLITLLASQAQIPVTLFSTGDVTIQQNFIITGNLTVDGTVSINGSADTGTPSNNNTSTNGLTNGTIAGTSGAQSAGTAHTHGAGSYAVNNGTHSHNLNSHLHPL